MNKKEVGCIQTIDIVKKNTDLLPLSMKEVEERIAVIRNQEVIADADVAFLYGVKTREVNRRTSEWRAMLA